MNNFAMPNEINQKKNGWVGGVLVLLVIVVAMYFGYKLLNTDKVEDTQEENLMVVDLTDNGDEDEEEVQETDTPIFLDGTETFEEEDEEDTVTIDYDNFDFSDFSTLEQAVGEEGSSEYTLVSVLDGVNTGGYHTFTFKIEGKNDTTETPNIIARYSAALGSIRVDLNNITTDNSGIGYQTSREVNEDGITQLYHNISGDPTEELYDIGIASETEFLITSEELSEGEWNIIVAVKYPGESTVEADLGSTEFSMDSQTIDGAGTSEGAKVIGYSYSSTGGVLKVIFLVSGSTDKPIPSVSAGYNSSDELEVWFTDLASNIVPESVDLPGGVTMVRTTQGDGYSYELQGTGGEYKLSATLSPNQVVVEVKL